MKKILLITLLMITVTAGFAQGKYRSRQQPAPQRPLYETGLFRSIDGTYFDLENDAVSGVQGQLNILNWLQGRVAGLQIHTIRGNRVPFIRNYPAAIYVDEIRTDASFLNMLPVNDIAMIKVMKMPGLFSGPGGAIAVYTKRGEGDDEEEEDARR